MMALLEHIFNLPKNDRLINFQTVSEVTNLPLQSVELILMKAMSLNLIKGLIDQVSFTSTVVNPS